MRRRFVLGAVLGVLFGLGWWAGGGHASRGLYSGLDLFVEVLQTVSANYVDPVDPGKLVTGAMRGMAHGLDPWSRYLDAEEFRATRNTIQGTSKARPRGTPDSNPATSSPRWTVTSRSGSRPGRWPPSCAVPRARR